MIRILFLAPMSIALTVTFVGFALNAKDGGDVTTNSALSPLHWADAETMERIS